jgi:hypothetical protein
LALFSLIPYWLQTKADIVVARYASLRLNLAFAINWLDDSVYWQKYKTSHPTAESMSMAELLDARIVISSNAEGTNKPPSKDAVTADNKTQQATLSAPSLIISTQVELPGVHESADFLGKLNDSELLMTSRKVSNYYNQSIYRWINKLYSLIERNRANETSTPVVLFDPTPAGAEQPENLIQTVRKEALLKYLTLADVRELAKFELPEIPPDTTRFASGLGKETDITLGSLPRNLYMATLFAQALLLFVIVYFSAFAREAVSSAAFPVRGTLFSAFSRSYSTLAVFFLALWVPFAASVSVSVASHKWPIVIFTVLIFFAGLSVHIVLHRKSYFKRLKFWCPNAINH